MSEADQTGRAKARGVGESGMRSIAHLPLTRRDAAIVSACLLGLLALYPVSDTLFDVGFHLAFMVGAVAMLEMARNLRRFVRDDYPLVLALSVGSVALLQLAHAIAMPSLGIIGMTSPDIDEKLILGSGLVLVVSMLAAPWAAGRRLRFGHWAAGLAAVTTLIVVAVFLGPDFIVTAGPKGPTGVAIVADFVIGLGLIVALFLTHRRRARLDSALAAGVEFALVVATVEWLARPFVRSDNFTGVMSVLFVAVLYIAVTENGLAKPTDLMVSELQESGQEAAAGRAHALDELRASEEKYLTIFEQSPAGLLLFDRSLVITHSNERLWRLLECSEDDIVGRDLHDLPDPDLVLQIAGSLEGRLGVFEGRLRNDFNAGEELWLSVRAAPLKDASGEVAGGMAIFVDLSEAKQAEDLIQQLALHDPLTGLANRTLFHERLQQAIVGGEAGSSPLAVLYIDLDRFIDINHLVGHGPADKVLQEVAERMSSACAEADTVARWGGDEFAILLPDVPGSAGVMRKAERIALALATPWQLDEHEISIAASIGIALYPQDGLDAETLLEHAAMAEDRAKKERGGCYRFYDPHTDDLVKERIGVEAELRQALKKQQLRLYYQPQVGLGAGEFVGVEALVRWMHPERGLLQPAAFLPVAEASDLIDELTAWVVGEACRQAADWQRAGHPLRVAVNVSARDFRSGHVVGVVEAALETTGLDPRLLEVELTETAIVEDMESTTRQLEALRARGISVALDDFGTGYSSLSHLRLLPISRVKIDRSFVSGSAHDARAATIVRTMIDLIQGLGAEVVAEGVEDKEDLDFLTSEGCDIAQGYYFSRPVSNDELVSLLSPGWAGEGHAQPSPAALVPLRRERRRQPAQHSRGGEDADGQGEFTARREPERPQRARIATQRRHHAVAVHGAQPHEEHDESDLDQQRRSVRGAEQARRGADLGQGAAHAGEQHRAQREAGDGGEAAHAGGPLRPAHSA
jgi:diguanylate cyclase (GGDEF)-like protein/PAS domain S-box-containing protein